MIKNYFENIDSEEKAYWLGFLYADGCVSKDLKTICLDLNIVDKSHIYKFAMAIKSNHKIWIHGENNQYIRLAVHCKRMAIDLCNKGCVPKKSLILEFPNEDIINKNLINHFIRGYFDGDGCISHCVGTRKRKDRIPGKLYPYDKWFLKFVGTESMMKGISYYMDMNNKIYNQIKGKNHYTLKCGGKKLVKEKMDILYKNATVYLDRKYDKYLQLCSKCS